MSTQPKSFRLLPSQWAALESAAREHRKRTGDPVAVSDLLRRAAAAVCADVGVPWPS